ncbi:hypothetical protein CXG81DRAFT_26506 [Caulochytrium protostelioides]|uniref:Sorting nexin MVP1 n=1 Tax=Caulochytrium protostelioides TaxID=1555241 RepID=A0A4P9X6K0_9FUNG|nr:hypothetical protein CXG81DRAFT_26506 [Caulochytrium protostelioides]|eukprot:RKP00805.1 hypothetical protein CXG81DRAFT_26506 [Caulochytrium protostelioides]
MTPDQLPSFPRHELEDSNPWGLGQARPADLAAVIQTDPMASTAAIAASGGGAGLGGTSRPLGRAATPTLMTPVLPETDITDPWQSFTTKPLATPPEATAGAAARERQPSAGTGAESAAGKHVSRLEDASRHDGHGRRLPDDVLPSRGTPALGRHGGGHGASGLPPPAHGAASSSSGASPAQTPSRHQHTWHANPVKAVSAPQLGIDTSVVGDPDASRASLDRRRQMLALSERIKGDTRLAVEPSDGDPAIHVRIAPEKGGLILRYVQYILESKLPVATPDVTGHGYLGSPSESAMGGGSATATAVGTPSNAAAPRSSSSATGAGTGAGASGPPTPGHPASGSSAQAAMSPFLAAMARPTPRLRHVTRRYSDFAWLRQHLLRVFPHRLVPLLPPKKLDRSDVFIERRRRGLARFINALHRHPVLGAYMVVRAFLLIPRDWSAWVKEREDRLPVSDELTRTPLTPAARQMVPPAFVVTDLLSREIPDLLACYESLCGVLERLARRQDGTALDYMDFSSTLAKSATIDACVHAALGNGVCAPCRQIGATLTRIGTQINAVGQIQEETAHAVYDYILEELVEIRDMLLAGVELMQRAQKTQEHVGTEKLESRYGITSAKLLEARAHLEQHSASPLSPDGGRRSPDRRSDSHAEPASRDEPASDSYATERATLSRAQHDLGHLQTQLHQDAEALDAQKEKRDALYYCLLEELRWIHQQKARLPRLFQRWAALELSHINQLGAHYQTLLSTWDHPHLPPPSSSSPAV